MAEAPARSGSNGPRRNGPRSVIKFSPEMPWPVLDDSDKDVEGHVYRFRQMCGMMNDGEGCKASEMLVFFGRTLTGTKRSTYETEFKRHMVTRRVLTHAEEVTEDIITQIGKINAETPLQKEIRLEQDLGIWS